MCITYNEVEVEGSEENLRLLHYLDGVGWEDATVLPVDIINDIICGTVTALSPFAIAELVPCCNGDGLRGDVDSLAGAGGEIGVADLTYLVAYVFQSGSAPPCADEGTVDSIVGAGGPIDVADLTYLVAYLFLSGPAPAACP